MTENENVESAAEADLASEEVVEALEVAATEDETIVIEEEAGPLGEGILVERTDAEGIITTEALEWTAPVLARVDDQDTLPHALLDRVQRGPRRPLAEVKEPITGSWRTVTAGDFWEYVNKIAQGLIGMGLKFGDPIAIMSRTRYEWMVLDFAAWAAGLVPIPIYETSSKAQIEFILSDAGVKFAITESVVMANLVAAAAEDIGSDLTILSLDQGAMGELESAGVSVHGSEVTVRTNQLTLDSTATIVYTSGTTGTPKGTVITHGNFTDLCKNSHLWMPEVCDFPKARMLLFLPLAHILARFLQVYVVTGEGVIGHTSDIKHLLPDLQSFRPTFLLVVPRVLEKIYNSADAKTGAGAKNKLFRWAANVAVEYSRALDTPEGPSRQLRMQRQIGDALVYSKLTNLVGGNVEIIISGGAPLSQRLAHFFRGAGLPIQEGYGLTETTGPLAVNTPQLTKIGSVGPVLPPMRVKISDQGEVLVKGPAVFKGYLKRDDQTALAFDEDGWFRTGDLGWIDKDGYLFITGRMKEVIVTAGGKNVIPSVLEDSLRGHPLISQVVVVGDQRPFIGALITLDDEMMQIWLKNKGLPAMTVSEAVRHPEIRASLSAAIDRANEGVSRAESIRKFEILPNDFTEANGLMTPSMKVKRTRVLERHAADIDALYGGPVEQG
ncbi:AMP-dependent synthetase/ligase [Actinomyces minihominis]|uniref:AMP-dependent synthetase/ligase n=1 Tax=Actinomyces minihominis TaxID=2002838 RepID=UPI000C0861AD|nr:AMP-dependent synthetase/ligase [Actinomyces minihominis]